MTESEKKIYRQVAQLLYNAGIIVRSDDREAIHLIGKIADSLTYLDGDFEEEYDLGVMHEISQWVGLMLDAPEMAGKYGRDIKEGYPEVLDPQSIK